ncbi:hypothetical protein [Aurantibacter sp.]|uniref:hypothetical protein n=1 Tax=Aurantibacter sp. TaxID=2807103 RepID=UPI0035C7F8F3
MKPYLILIALFFTFSISAQDSVKVKAPRVTMQQHLNIPIQVNSVSIELIKVLSDSRCPKGVNCIRAGEAKILVEIIEAGEIIKRKEIVIQAANHPNNYPLVFEDRTIKVFAVDLLPYPVYNNKTEDKDYIFKVEKRQI